MHFSFFICPLFILQSYRETGTVIICSVEGEVSSLSIEEEFRSEISDREAEKILTVGDAVKFIEGKAN